MSKVWHGGKGSARRKEDKKKIDENWDKIFRKKRKKRRAISPKILLPFAARRSSLLHENKVASDVDSIAASTHTHARARFSSSSARWYFFVSSAFESERERENSLVYIKNF